MDSTLLPLLWLVTILASVLRAFTGFGFALAAVPGFVLLLPPAQAVALCASLSLAIGVQTWPDYRGEIALRPLWPMFIMSVMGTILGARLLLNLPVNTFLQMAGVVVVVASLILTRLRLRPRKLGVGVVAGTGLCSGLMNGALAIPGPPVVIYAMATQSGPAASRALMITVFTFSSLVALVTYAASGLLGMGTLWLFLLVYPAMYLGDKLGYQLFTNYGSRFHRTVALSVLLLLGLSISLKGFLA